MPPRIGRIGDWSNDPEERDNHSDDDKEKRESWFAGGERSGISIQNPNRQREAQAPGGNLVRDLLRRAAEGGPPPPEHRETGGFRVFSGGGHTLGSDELPSSFIADPNAQSEEEEVAVRMITFWQDGFQIEDGDLMRYDDPNNAQILAELNAGNAPVSLLNVRTGQPVELRVAQRMEEPYRPPAGVRAFRGSGHRLGAPVNEPTQSSSSAMPGTFPSSSASTSALTSSNSPPTATTQSVNPRFQVDQNKPTTSVQVRLADGTRIVCRMNLGHTVGDIRAFINASRPENLARPYTIGTTFPNRILDDDSATIEGAGLVNSVVVQRWV